MVWIGPRGFQKSSTNQSLPPRSLHSRGGTLPSGGFGSYCSKAASWELAVLPEQHGSDWGASMAPQGEVPRLPEPKLPAPTP